MNALIPANDIWASDTWPTYPVSTTRDRHRQIHTTDAISATRSEPCSRIMAATPATNIRAAVATGRAGRPIDGLRQ